MQNYAHRQSRARLCVHKLAQPLLAFTVMLLGATSSNADQPTILDTRVSHVAVNGGADTENAGTTCVRVTAAVSSTCPSGWVAIKNNNKLLIAAALQAKATDALIWFFYDDAGSQSLHCPGHQFTPCSVISITVK